MQILKKKNQDAASAAGVTVRSLLVGSLMTLGISTIAPYSNMILRGSKLCPRFQYGRRYFFNFFSLCFLFKPGSRPCIPA